MVDSNIAVRIRSELETFWREQSLGLNGDSTSIDDMVAAMDSLTSVEVLLRLEVIVGTDLPAAMLIRPGGYSCEKQFVDELAVRVLEHLGEQGK